jgi:hypothetical protein
MRCDGFASAAYSPEAPPAGGPILSAGPILRAGPDQMLAGRTR